MMIGKCVDQELAGSFPEFVYLFPNGSDYFYVSQFPNKYSHTGCFEARKFHVIKESILLKESKHFSNIDPLASCDEQVKQIDKSKVKKMMTSMNR
ncbi:hypothetical protein ACH0BF_16435 [Pseudobacillus sp. 179-B 2D1 NHS]|uniref:hypothetical protein n=1 Tax=Pseudobacillus sp. 179-B 2D1 NHS TaxID=3374292 RepID=UPI003879D281